MSIRDLKKYYGQIEQQFYEMNQSAKELNEECAKGNVPQSMVDQAEQMVLPLKQNYERLSYVLYLLNKPNRQKKVPKYVEQNSNIKNFSKNVGATDGQVIDESYDALVNFKKYIANLKEEKNET